MTQDLQNRPLAFFVRQMSSTIQLFKCSPDCRFFMISLNLQPCISFRKLYYMTCIILLLECISKMKKKSEPSNTIKCSIWRGMKAIYINSRYQCISVVHLRIKNEISIIKNKIYS